MTERLKLDQLIALERASLERDEGARAATWQRLSVSLGLAGGASLQPLTGALGSSVSSSATATNAGAVASSASSAGSAGAASIGVGSAGMGAAAGAAGGVGGASLGAAGGGGAGVATGSVLAKVVAGVALVTSTSLGGAYWWSAPETVSSGASIAQQTAEPKTPPAGVTAGAPRPSMEPEPSAVAELPTSNEQARPVTAPKLTAVPARKTGSGDFDGELMRIQKAQGALASGDNRRALSILGDRKDPSKSQFDEDRDAVRALALCRTSDPQAVSFARRFLARHPNSVYVEGVRAACFAASGPAPRPSR